MSCLWWELRKTRHTLKSVDAAYDKDIAKLEEEGKSDDVEQCKAAWLQERQTCDEEVDSVLTRIFLKQAEKFDVETPDYPNTSSPERKNDYWYWAYRTHR